MPSASAALTSAPCPSRARTAAVSPARTASNSGASPWAPRASTRDPRSTSDAQMHVMRICLPPTMRSRGHPDTLVSPERGDRSPTLRPRSAPRCCRRSAPDLDDPLDLRRIAPVVRQPMVPLRDANHPVRTLLAVQARLADHRLTTCRRRASRGGAPGRRIQSAEASGLRRIVAEPGEKSRRLVTPKTRGEEEVPFLGQFQRRSSNSVGRLHAGPFIDQQLNRGQQTSVDGAVQWRLTVLVREIRVVPNVERQLHGLQHLFIGGLQATGV